MDGYIEKETAIAIIMGEPPDAHYPHWYADKIKAIPAADVAPVRHGRWVLLDECYNEGVYCSACHKKVYKTCYANQKIKSKFCPNCGAIMDGGAENG